MNFYRRGGILLSLCFAAIPVGRAAAATVPPPSPPSASVVIGDVLYDLSDFIRPMEDGKMYILNVDGSFGDTKLMVNAVYNTDPFISFGVTTVNAGPGPVSYTFMFGTPIVPGFYDSATSTGGVTVTNGSVGLSTVANGGGYPGAFISGYGTLGLVPTNLAVDLGTGPIVAGPGTPFGVTVTSPFGTASSSFAPTWYDNLEAVVSYTQTDTGSVASWSGAVTINAAIPEPASVVMVGMGAVVLGAACARRRRAV